MEGSNDAGGGVQGPVEMVILPICLVMLDGRVLMGSFRVSNNPQGYRQSPPQELLDALKR